MTWISIPCPNTPSFWLLCSYKHVDTKNRSQFLKKFFTP